MAAFCYCAAMEAVMAKTGPKSAPTLLEVAELAEGLDAATLPDRLVVACGHCGTEHIALLTEDDFQPGEIFDCLECGGVIRVPDF